MVMRISGKGWVIGIVLVLLASFISGNSHSVQVDHEVLEHLQHNGEASVIVLLKNEGLQKEKMPAILTDGAPENRPQEVQQKVRQEVFDSLILKGDETPVLVSARATPTMNNDEQPEEPSQEQTKEVSESPAEDYDLDLVRQYSSINGFSGTVTTAGLEKLQDNPLVEKIYYNTILHPALDVSVPLMNANDVWNLSVGGYNISGRLETVCMIDTGIDTDHPAFQDKILDQHCFCNANNEACCAGSKTEALTAEDDHGHGTHTAGTAAGNLSTYTGVAKDARIVAMKVCNNASSAACATADVISAINWCTSNATTYNISVISISLGGGGPYNSYCNDDALAPSINSAVGKNISVVVSAGNSGFTNGISSPACVQNATPVGAVDDNDGILYNRGAILDLLAPGSGIIAPYIGGGTTSLSGTSMSAPHVAGAIALFRQYYRLAYSRTPTPDEIKTKLRITGKLIDDSSNSGRNYSRIDILAALQPFLNYTITNPANNSVTGSNSVLINITSDVNLTNALLEWGYNNGTRTNLSMNKVNGTQFNLNVGRLADGADTYFVYGNDTVGTLGISITRTVTIDTIVPAVTIRNPVNGTNLSSGTQAFNATINEININAVRFSFSNVTGVAFNVTPTNVSGNWNMNLDLTRLMEGRQTMTVLANDSAGNYNRTSFIDFIVDRTAPTVTVLTPLSDRNFSRTADNQTFNLTVREPLLAIDTVLLSFDNASGTNFNATAINQSGNWLVSYNVSSLAEGAQIVTILVNDTAGNYNRTVNITFTVDFTAPTVTANSAANQNFTFLSSNQTFNVTIRDNLLNLHDVIFSFDNSSGTGFNLSAANQSGYWFISYNVSLLGNGSHILAILANDTAGNLNNTQNMTFTVDIFSPIVTLNRPTDLSNSSSSSVTFNCTSQDNRELYNATLYGNWTGSWHANETVRINGTTNESTFSKTLADGNYRWNCLTSDADGYTAFAPANFTLNVDTTLPFISSISSGTPTATAATITWTTNEPANSSMNYGTSLSLGTLSTSLSRKTSHSQSLSSLTASTPYFYNISSCDSVGNCNVTGSYNFSTAAAASSGSGDGSGGGGGAGGGGSGSGSGGSTIGSQAASETPAVKTPETPTPTEAEAVAAAQAVVPTAEPVIFSQPISIVKGGKNLITVSQAGIPVRQLTIDSKTSKETVLTFTTFSEKPVEIPDVKGVYQYFEMNVDLTDDEVKRAVVTFIVPESWLKDNNFIEQTVKLNTLEGKEWKELPTTLSARGENEVVYEAKLKHFSYFAITGRSELELTWFGKLIPPTFGTKEFVFFGLLVLIAILVGIYFLIREEE